MTNDFSFWLNGVPVIGFGDPDFGSWLNGTPYVDIGAAGGGAGIIGGSRIVSPRQERNRAAGFSSAPWHIRTVSPQISIGRSPA